MKRMAVLFALCTFAASSLFAATATWNGSSSSDFGTAGNWTPSGVPGGADDIIINGGYTTELDIDSPRSVLSISLGASSVSSMKVNAALTVGVDLNIYGNGTLTANDPVTVSNNVTISSGGVLTHDANTTTDANGVCLTIGGDLQVDVGGSINVDILGYGDEKGPGAGDVHAQGGSHGGRGGLSDYSPYPHSDTYGDIVAPTNSGSGGWDVGEGGGRVKLDVAGETRVNGTITSDGDGAGSGDGGGAGGSVFLTTGTMSGNGSITADGGANTSSGSGGGGGRVAVVLSGSTSFGAVSITAYGGTSSANVRNGAAGTIYQEKSTDTSGQGELIVDNNDTDPNVLSGGTKALHVVTDMNGIDAVTNTFVRLTLRNAGRLAIGPDDALILTGATLTVDASDDKEGIRLFGGTLTVDDPLSYEDFFIAIMDSASTLDMALNVGTNAGFIVNVPFTLSKALTIEGGGNLTHDYNTTSEENILDLSILSLTVETNGSVDVSGKGYTINQGPGAGNQSGTYGGHGGYDSTPGDTYGSVIAPTNLGSGGDNGRGGGAVMLRVSGTTELYGDITANGADATGDSGSGGSVNLTTASLVGDGTILARGGQATGGNGGGGRIAVKLSSGSSFDGVTMSARGGILNATAGNRGAAGTIYREAASDGAGQGTVLVDNEGSTSTRLTDLLPDSQFIDVELENATLVVSNSNTRLNVWSNLVVGDIVAYENTVITLGVYTMLVNSAEHYIDDRGQSGPGGPTNVIDDYSHVIWLGFPSLGSGTVIKFQ